MKIPLTTAVGDRDLCVWQPVKGITWVQTRNPRRGRRRTKRRDGRLVAYGVTANAALKSVSRPAPHFSSP